MVVAVDSVRRHFNRPGCNDGFSQLASLQHSVPHCRVYCCCMKLFKCTVVGWNQINSFKLYSVITHKAYVLCASVSPGLSDPSLRQITIPKSLLPQQNFRSSVAVEIITMVLMYCGRNQYILSKSVFFGFWCRLWFHVLCFKISRSTRLRSRRTWNMNHWKYYYNTGDVVHER